MIDGVLIEPLKIFVDARGKVMRMLRCDDYFFSKFGEVYFSVVNAGAVKGWKKHTKMTQHFSVPVGNIKLVIYDDRDGSPTLGEVQEIGSGEGDYKLIRIPPLVWYSFAASGGKQALIANCSDLIHDPGEALTLDVTDNRIPYCWSLE